MKITLPLQQLPESTDDRHQMIADYFSGKEYRLDFIGEMVDIHLTWPKNELYYIDEKLEDGLKWWGNKLTVGGIPYAVQEKPFYQFSLNDNWTLHAWSKWLDAKVQKGKDVKKVIILHVDDHRDCMSPLLFAKGTNSYFDPLTGKPVSMSKPESIISAIESGAIAVGSFMPIFFHHIPNIEFRHLLPTHRMATAYQVGGIKIDFEKDDLLCPECDRPNMIFEDQTENSKMYYPTADLTTFMADIPTDVPVILHVDMDYFNNRFDGDSDWQMHSVIHDPKKERVLDQVSEVFGCILRSIPRSQLENVSIALSPGFFPVEFWDEATAIIDLKFKENDQ
ncbi:hypothetical protein [Pedobacter sp. P26]|uniref:hypothetical protein n=1 Tax=Pedobacter sp. P26 TaxID=3423956 RepID=UPI003D676C46